MKKAILIILVFTLIDLNTKAQTWTWAKNIPVQDNSDIGLAICSDDSGNVIVAGSFQSSSITFGSTTLTNLSGYNNIFVVKYSPDGSVSWAQTANATDIHGDDDACSSIAVDKEGNIYITGWFGSDSITFGNYILTSIGGLNIFVVKYSPLGSVLWATAGGSVNNEGGYNEGQGISTDTAGNVLVSVKFHKVVELNKLALI